MSTFIVRTFKPTNQTVRSTGSSHCTTCATTRRLLSVPNKRASTGGRTHHDTFLSACLSETPIPENSS
jgi:hypothetical protein